MQIGLADLLIIKYLIHVILLCKKTREKHKILLLGYSYPLSVWFTPPDLQKELFFYRSLTYKRSTCY